MTPTRSKAKSTPAIEFCGGEPSDITVAGRVPDSKRELAFDATLIEKLTGLKLHEAEAFGILAKLGFNIVVGRRVTIPSWRPDIHGTTDLVEEVVRIAGLDRVPSTPLPRLTSV